MRRPTLSLEIYHQALLQPHGSDDKESAFNAGDPGSIPGSRRCPGGGNGNSLQYFAQRIPWDGGAWKATVHGVAKSRTRLSNFAFTFATKKTESQSDRQGLHVASVLIQVV